MKLLRKRKSVGLDLDSCLNNLEIKWLADYNEDYDDNITPKDLLTWDTWMYVKPECGKKIFNYLSLPNYFRELDPKPFTQEVTQWLVKHFDIYIVTAYIDETCSDKVKWMQEHYPWIPKRNIMFVNDKSKVDLDYLVDDGPHNVTGFKGQAVLMDMQYNKFLHNKYPRCENYLDVKSYFENELKKERKIYYGESGWRRKRIRNLAV